MERILLVGIGGMSKCTIPAVRRRRQYERETDLKSRTCIEIEPEMAGRAAVGKIIETFGHDYIEHNDKIRWGRIIDLSGADHQAWTIVWRQIPTDIKVSRTLLFIVKRK